MSSEQMSKSESMPWRETSNALSCTVAAEGRRRKRAFASHLTDLPEEVLESESAASEAADADPASPARQRRRSAKGAAHAPGLASMG